ncbi:MAG: FadR family transcriptional regulator [Labilithrix sp.]|nr:FadR family transcriptional regulator [Labilithrix sp.]
MPTDRKADTIARDLLERIVRGDIAVGDLLPKEDELAASYGSARSVVREAIKLLEVHKLVRPTRRLGTVALDPLASPSPDVVRAMLVRGGTIDLDVFAGWLEIRAVLDVQMTVTATTRRTAADLAALGEVLEGLRAAARDPAAFGRETARLALVLARATQNPLFTVLAQWHASVVADLEHVFVAIRSAGVPHVDGIALLVECIRKKDEARARELVEMFHAWATPRLLAAARLANGEAPPAPRARKRARQ